MAPTPITIVPTVNSLDPTPGAWNDQLFWNVLQLGTAPHDSTAINPFTVATGRALNVQVSTPFAPVGHRVSLWKQDPWVGPPAGGHWSGNFAPLDWIAACIDADNTIAFGPTIQIEFADLVYGVAGQIQSQVLEQDGFFVAQIEAFDALGISLGAPFQEQGQSTTLADNSAICLGLLSLTREIKSIRFTMIACGGYFDPDLGVYVYDSTIDPTLNNAWGVNQLALAQVPAAPPAPPAQPPYVPLDGGLSGNAVSGLVVPVWGLVGAGFWYTQPNGEPEDLDVFGEQRFVIPHQTIAASSTSQGFTLADEAIGLAILTVDTGAVRWLVSGEDPSDTDGNYAAAGTVIALAGIVNVRNFRCVLATGVDAANVVGNFARP